MQIIFYIVNNLALRVNNRTWHRNYNQMLYQHKILGTWNRCYKHDLPAAADLPPADLASILAEFTTQYRIGEPQSQTKTHNPSIHQMHDSGTFDHE